MALWVLKPGQRGEHEEHFLENDLACLTFSSIPSLCQITTREQMNDLFLAAQPDAPRRSVMSYSGQSWAFRGLCRFGDIIVLPLKSSAKVAAGWTTGDYCYDRTAQDPYRHQRDVLWSRQLIAKADLDTDLRYSIAAKKTFCKANCHDAERRFRRRLNGVLPPPPVADQLDATSEPTTSPDLLRNLERRAWKDLKLHIEQNFSGHAMARLVAEVLRVDGYFVQDSAVGPDGGCDILAARGQFGFDHPKLCVQVKRTSKPATVEVLRSLLGTMQMLGATHGLLVSWSGFTQAACREATQMFFSVRLMDGDQILEHVLERYDALPEAVKESLPMRQVWVLQDQKSAGASHPGLGDLAVPKVKFQV